MSIELPQIVWLPMPVYKDQIYTMQVSTQIDNLAAVALISYKWTNGIGG